RQPLTTLRRLHQRALIRAGAKQRLALLPPARLIARIARTLLLSRHHQAILRKKPQGTTPPAPPMAMQLQDLAKTPEKPHPQMWGMEATETAAGAIFDAFRPRPVPDDLKPKITHRTRLPAGPRPLLFEAKGLPYHTENPRKPPGLRDTISRLCWQCSTPKD